MKIKRLNPEDFVPGKRYSLLGVHGGEDILNAYFVRFEQEGIMYTLHFHEPDQKESREISFNHSGRGINVVVHDDLQYYIMIGVSFVIGVFNEKSDADMFLQKNKEVIEHLQRESEGAIPDIYDSEHMKEFIFPSWKIGYYENGESNPLWLDRHFPLEKCFSLNRSDM